MKKFETNPGVNRFETGGPEGLITIEAGSPFLTDDPAVISILEDAGAHALTISDVAPAGDADKKHLSQPPKLVEPPVQPLVQPKGADS